MKQPKAFFHIILVCSYHVFKIDFYSTSTVVKKSETVVFSADNVTSVTSQNNGLMAS